MAGDVAEVEAKLAFDQGLALLGAQRTDLKDMQSKAKDLIGLLTLSVTFLGAFGKAYADGILSHLHGQKWPWLVVLVALPILTLIAGLYVMTPSSKWTFNLDAASVKRSMNRRIAAHQQFDSVADLYLAYVDVFDRLQLGNQDRIRRRKYAVLGATLFLASTIVYTGWLVLSASPVSTN